MTLLDILTKNGPKGIGALEIGSQGSSFAHIIEPNKPIPEVKIVRTFSDLRDPAALRSELFDVVSKHHLFGLNCNLVLHPDHYRLLLIDRPNVLQSELLNAAKWQVKDMIDYPLEEIVVDIFFPPALLKSVENKMYVVVANKLLLQGYVDFLRSCELRPISIDIHELAIRNVFNLFAANTEEPIALLQVFDKRCLFMIFQNGEINFIRRIQLSNEENLGGVEKQLPLEIERSLNYYRLEFRSDLPTKLYLSPAAQIKAEALNKLQELSSFEINKLDLNALFNIEECLGCQDSELCLTTLGGALRDVK